MLSDENLLLSVRESAGDGQRVPVLLLLSQVDQPAATIAVREKGVKIGFRKISQWNVTDVMKKAAMDGQVAQLSNGWKLTTPGFKVIEKYYKPEAAIIAETRHALKSHLEKISDGQRRSFVEEAIRSFDVKAYRAAIVLSWVGASHILQEHVVKYHRADFNAAGATRVTKATKSGNTYNFRR